MSEMPDEDHGWMILGIFIALVIQFALIDVAIVYLSKIAFVHSVAKYRGYWYNYEIANDWLNFGKRDE